MLSKYRHKVLVEGVAQRLEQIMQEVSQERWIEIPEADAYVLSLPHGEAIRFGS